MGTNNFILHSNQWHRKRLRASELWYYRTEINVIMTIKEWNNILIPILCTFTLSRWCWRCIFIWGWGGVFVWYIYLIYVHTCVFPMSWDHDTYFNLARYSNIYNLPNGRVELSRPRSGNIATFTCNKKYTLCGPDMITCTSSRRWDRTMPVCELYYMPYFGTFLKSF